MLYVLLTLGLLWGGCGGATEVQPDPSTEADAKHQADHGSVSHDGHSADPADLGLPGDALPADSAAPTDSGGASQVADSAVADDDAQGVPDAVGVADVADTGAGGAATLSFEFIEEVVLPFGNLWCIPVYDGERLVVSVETNGRIEMAPMNPDLTLMGPKVEVAGPQDTATGDGIADHKHLFQGGHHYLTFSTSGGGQGGVLHLMKLDKDFQRVKLVTVVEGAPPTNDMVMVSDGSDIHVGKFLPGVGHEIYSYDTDLNFLGKMPIGGSQNSHANGAGLIYVEPYFYLVAPMTLAPGMNHVYSRIVFDRSWEVVKPRKVILEDQGMLSLVTGLSWEPETKTFIVHYTRSGQESGGPLYRALFEAEDWDLIDNQQVVDGKFHRPHSVIIGDELFVGYDADGFKDHLARWSIVID